MGRSPTIDTTNAGSRGHTLRVLAALRLLLASGWKSARIRADLDTKFFAATAQK